MLYTIHHHINKGLKLRTGVSHARHQVSNRFGASSRQNAGIGIGIDIAVCN